MSNNLGGNDDTTARIGRVPENKTGSDSSVNNDSALNNKPGQNNLGGNQAVRGNAKDNSQKADSDFGNRDVATNNGGGSINNNSTARIARVSENSSNNGNNSASNDPKHAGRNAARDAANAPDGLDMAKGVKNLKDGGSPKDQALNKLGDKLGLKFNNDDPTKAAKTDLTQANGAEGQNPAIASKTLDSAGGDPIDAAANKLKSGLGKKALKAGEEAAPKMAELYVGGKLFDSMMKMAGLMINGASATVQAAIVNSPLGGFINWLHGVGTSIINGIKTAGAAIGHGAHAVASAIGHGANAIGHAVQAGASGLAHGLTNAANGLMSTFTGQTVQAATITTSTVLHGSMVLGASAVLMGGGYALTFFNAGQRDAQQPAACQELVQNAEEGGKVNANQKEEENAKLAYSVFKTYGMTDDAIAGILGNWTKESSIDPTILEGFSGIEMYHIGPRKKAALAHLSAYAHKMAAAAGGNYSGYGNCPGLGLGQWTSQRGLDLLAAAKKANKKWYDMGFQLAYVLAEPSEQAYVKKYGRETGVDRATMDWFRNWEGIDNGTGGEREGYAHSWRAKMKNWKVDNKAANNVLAMAKHLGTKATAAAVNDAANNCARAQGSANNSSLVWAALSYAWDSDDLAKGNNGTPLYKKVHRGIFPGDPHFMSCDRVVAVAVRWSGTDIKYPAGSTAEQYQHAMSDSHWKKVGTTNSMHYSELKPGDIFIDNGVHTFLFVGNENVKESIKKNMHSASKTPKNGDEVDGSLNERSAGIGVDGRYSIEHGDGNTYTIFRNVKSDHSHKYDKVAALTTSK